LLPEGPIALPTKVTKRRKPANNLTEIQILLKTVGIRRFGWLIRSPSSSEAKQ
jgi:hypothetical protein